MMSLCYTFVQTREPQLLKMQDKLDNKVTLEGVGSIGKVLIYILSKKLAKTKLQNRGTELTYGSP